MGEAERVRPVPFTGLQALFGKTFDRHRNLGIHYHVDYLSCFRFHVGNEPLKWDPRLTQTSPNLRGKTNVQDFMANCASGNSGLTRGCRFSVGNIRKPFLGQLPLGTHQQSTNRKTRRQRFNHLGSVPFYRVIRLDNV